MIRGGKNYKKKSSDPKHDCYILENIMADAEKSPPERVKQPFNTNQPYQPSPFGEDRPDSLAMTKKSG